MDHDHSYNLLFSQADIGGRKKSVDLREVGLSQRLMVWAIIGWFIGFFPPAIAITIPFQLYSVYRLGRSLQLSAPAVAGYILLTFAPFICLLGFLALNRKAINVLRGAGIRVGLMGARKEDLPLTG
jgi:hypothetical protein